MTQRIFIYGTLKRGLANSHYMRGQTYVSDARTKPIYRMVNCGGYPGMYPVDQDGRSILGEIWDVDEAGRQRLDILEDVAVGLYELKPVALEPPFHEESITTYIYAWPVTGKPDAGVDWQH